MQLAWSLHRTLAWPLTWRWVEYQETGTGFLTPSLEKQLFERHEAHLLNKQERERDSSGSLVWLLHMWAPPSAVHTKNEPSRTERAKSTTAAAPTHTCTELPEPSSLLHIVAWVESASSIILSRTFVKWTRLLHSETDFIWWRRCLYQVSSTIWNQCSGGWAISMYGHWRWIHHHESRSDLYELLSFFNHKTVTDALLPVMVTFLSLFKSNI